MARSVSEAKKATETWWWTVTKFDGDCHECGHVIDAGMVVAWNHGLRIEVCKVCGERHNPAMSRAARRHFGVAKQAPDRKPTVAPQVAERRAQRGWAKPHALSVPCACGATVGEGCKTRAGKHRKPHSSRVSIVADSMAS